MEALALGAGEICKAPVEIVAEPRLNVLRNLDRGGPDRESDRTGPPGALVVIVGVGHGYTWSDGVALAPLTALGP